MKRKLGIGIVCCILAMGLQAETIRVMRFVPVAGEEHEVALDKLQKVVFTADSVVLISAQDGAVTPMYKYDYRSVLFTESDSEGIEGVQSTDRFTDRVQKFIKDGQLYIMYKGTMYNVQGRKVYETNF